MRHDRHVPAAADEQRGTGGVTTADMATTTMTLVAARAELRRHYQLYELIEMLRERCGMAASSQVQIVFRGGCARTSTTEAQAIRTVMLGELTADVDGALRLLSAEQRDFLASRYRDGRSLREVGEAHHMSCSQAHRYELLTLGAYIAARGCMLRAS